MKEAKKKIISRFCLFCVAAALLAAVILAPRPGGHSGVRLYRICVEGYDSIYAEENGQKEAFQTVFVVGTGRRPYSV